MTEIVKTEFLKLKRYFILWIGAALMLLTVLMTLFTSLAEDGLVWDFQVLQEQVIKNFVTLIFPMCITLLTGYIIARESADDTLKNIVTIPVSYQKLVTGKLIVSAFLSLLLGLVCYLFTVIANFAMGYSGFSLPAAFRTALQFLFLALFLYISVLPVIVLTSRVQNAFLAGVILSLVYGFLSMFTGSGVIGSLYPVSAALGLIRYRSYDPGVSWNTALCALSISMMLAFGILMIPRSMRPVKKERRRRP